MQHRVDALERRGELGGVADIALDDAQVRIVRQRGSRRTEVVDGDVVAVAEQPRRQHMTDIAGTARDQDVFNLSSPLQFRLLRSSPTAMIEPPRHAAFGRSSGGSVRDDPTRGDAIAWRS